MSASRPHVSGKLVTELAILLQRLADDLFEFRWKIRVQPHRWNRITIQNFAGDHSRAFTAEGSVPVAIS